MFSCKDEEGYEDGDEDKNSEGASLRMMSRHWYKGYKEHGGGSAQSGWTSNKGE